MELYCFGDSHVLVFQYIKENQFLKRTNISVCHVNGATALGMVNPHSKTNALRIFNQKVSSLPKDCSLLFMLGEVDCGFVIWYRAQKYNLSVTSQLEESIHNYLTFLKRIQKLGFKDVIVSTSPPPTIKDHQDWGEVANLRKGITATQIERTTLTVQYNQMLRQKCKVKGIKILDAEQDFINKSTGLVGRQFLNKNPLDHHLDSEAAAKVYIKKLKELGFE